MGKSNPTQAYPKCNCKSSSSITTKKFPMIYEFLILVSPSFDVVAVQSQIYKNTAIAHSYNIVNLSLGGAIYA
jgi:hypothetical protein